MQSLQLRIRLSSISFIIDNKICTLQTFRT